ncbi:hypothetical protein JKP88DRAFT_252573 [Tribonema minus]|uniref:Ankyrin repeat domain-containing protein n=1 Tax=Tribonema minus TaxID=303371 RepID=A0A835ZCL7_9STRA|nr:hypothetical protein JKP88DRAFT_252573 [Tribonema minus]
MQLWTDTCLKFLSHGTRIAELSFAAGIVEKEIRMLGDSILAHPKSEIDEFSELVKSPTATEDSVQALLSRWPALANLIIDPGYPDMLPVLSVASRAGNTAVAAARIVRKADVNALSAINKTTALSQAAAHARPAVVDLLLDNGHNRPASAQKANHRTGCRIAAAHGWGFLMEAAPLGAPPAGCNDSELIAATECATGCVAFSRCIEKLLSRAAVAMRREVGDSLWKPHTSGEHFGAECQGLMARFREWLEAQPGFQDATSTPAQHSAAAGGTATKDSPSLRPMASPAAAMAGSPLRAPPLLMAPEGRLITIPTSA